MYKSQRNPGRNAVFYKPVDVVKEIRSGYLYKSPPSHKLKSEKSWKKRYFVLYKVSENEHLLKYFRSAAEKERPLGGIDLTNISLLYESPQQHQRWGWIQKSFKCPPSCVLFIKAGDREYFLVGESSDDVDRWFSDLFDALKTRPYRFMNTEEITNGHQQIEVISNPVILRKKSSDPTEKQNEDARRPVSEPIYDYPKSYLRQAQVNGNGTNKESLYETMQEISPKERVTRAEDLEVERVTDSTLMRSVTLAFDKLKTQIPPLPSFSEEEAAEEREEAHPSDFSSSSSDNGTISPVEGRERAYTLENQGSTESLDHVTPNERDIEVNQADLKKHLSLIDVEGKTYVSGWTGQPQTVCLFHKGDQIVGINDLLIGNVKEFHIYISKSLKNQVKLTILRRPGCLPLHSPSGLCSDAQEAAAERHSVPSSPGSGCV
ncbi:pleckstrin homology domain-containing family S member 1-like isoform X3 [Solea solea]|uniref:pleckstrin homology domain-containing family S member 1-like isoform X3 n=1 Tax=Solea solea TaxID=90069 RepID=UPI00272D07C5|nr:pleckstrin homology domain-containing family S member 1-like isoform X3 [Solea solea]